MFLIPLLIGIVVAVALTFGSNMLRKKGFSTNKINAFTLFFLVIGVFIVAYGYVEVKGFEGFAYFLFGSPIILLSLITFIKNARKTSQFNKGYMNK